MGEVVNLRHARKTRARSAAGAAAAESRARHGRTAAEKARDTAEAERQERAIDGAKLEGDAGG